MVADLAAVVLGAQEAERLTMGMAVRCAAAPESGLVRVYGADQRFLGLGLAAPGGQLQPRRLIAFTPQTLRKHPITE
jgi:tRNA pseudouridine55 synthase